ncbi:MAG: zf-HC2 domain-containing protein [Acidobacteria bacterium]|nr:zf-HC2 domain-containing protein [Acidobacteriota bacterium]
MQVMDCRNFKEVLDSYISDELSVETNHAVLRHAELCAGCRGEMAARRNLRSTLRGAVTATTAPPDFRNRLRERLREEATVQATPISAKRDGFFSNWFRNLAVPQFAMATALLVLVAIGVVYLFSNSSPAYAAELSPALLNQATSDHDGCASIWRTRLFTENDPVHDAEKFDPTLLDLGKYSEHQALGLTFHYAHLCGHHGRKYVHLVYSRNNDLVSLFVAERDAAAMKSGTVPTDDGLQHGLQQFQNVQDKFTVSAYQTSKHVVLVVSTFTAQQNNEIAEKLAKPISLHLRKIESKN